MSTTEPTHSTYLEVQIHPAEIRWGVLYFFLTLRQVRIWLAVAVVLVLFLLSNVVLAPQVFTRLVSRNEYESLMMERTRQGERL